MPSLGNDLILALAIVGDIA